MRPLLQALEAAGEVEQRWKEAGSEGGKEARDAALREVLGHFGAWEFEEKVKEGGGREGWMEGGREGSNSSKSSWPTSYPLCPGHSHIPSLPPSPPFSLPPLQADLQQHWQPVLQTLHASIAGTLASCPQLLLVPSPSSSSSSSSTSSTKRKKEQMVRLVCA